MEGKTLDYVIIVVFLIGSALFGMLIGGKQKTVKDYFLGSKEIPWWAVCFSIVAAETSTLTFISIPGLAYLTNLNFLQVTFRISHRTNYSCIFFLPAYNKGELKTAYTFLENRFGGKTRSFASIIFLFTRTAADGVRLFATAIPLKLMLNIDYPLAIAIIAMITLVYTYTGGMKGVIWVDVILMFIYLGGAILSAVYLLNLIPGGWASVTSSALAENKLSVFKLGFENGIAGFFSQPYTLFGGLIGGAFLSMASHGTDQLIVQRLLSTKNLRDGQKAIIGSGIIVIIQFAIFLLVGVMLFAYYGKLDVKSDEIFPMFIINVLPAGISGLIIAGLFAAAMSTLAGSMTSLASSTMHDLYIPFFGKNLDDQKQLKLSRMFTIFWAGMLVISAILFMESSRAVVEIALSIASFTYGGLLGTFLLGILNKKAKQEDALAGFVAGIFIMISVISLKLVAWTWYTIIGVIATLLIGSLLNKLSDRS
ncbi:MAG: sodium:solute symporter [Ignavibacteriales bacterium]|nr:sodium:solute symporter [Ignavibacteriales bacterium]